MPSVCRRKRGTCPSWYRTAQGGTRAKAAKRVIVSGNPHDHQEGERGYAILVQHHFVRYFDASGQAHSAALLMEPKPHQYGKSGDALWAVAREDLFVAKEHGHPGISIAHYVFDGCPSQYMSRRARQEHMLRAVKRKATTIAAGLDHKEQLLLECVVSSQCAAHACHNALKWGARGEFRHTGQVQGTVDSMSWLRA